jgi:hypothetical protein
MQIGYALTTAMENPGETYTPEGFTRGMELSHHLLRHANLL